MKRTKSLICLLIVAILLCAPGCAPASTPDDIPDTSGTGDPLGGDNTGDPGGAETATEVVVQVDYATDALLAGYADVIDAYVEYEYAVKIILFTNAAAREFRYIAVELDMQGDEIVFLEGETRYALDVLTPETPLVVSADFPGSMPTQGITYLDETGAKRCFYISQSGNDGSLSLIEF